MAGATPGLPIIGGVLAPPASISVTGAIFFHSDDQAVDSVELLVFVGFRWFVLSEIILSEDE